MEETTKQLYEGIHQAVIKALPPELKVLHISLAGSKGKKLDSPTSDYDVKVIVLNK